MNGSLASLAAIGGVIASFVSATAHPYETIVQRNAFALRPVAALPAAPPLPPANPPRLTGVAVVDGTPRAFLMEAKPASARHWELGPGQGEGPLQVLKVDAAGGRVDIRLDGRQHELQLGSKSNAGR